MSAALVPVSYKVDVDDLDFFTKLAIYSGKGTETMIRKRAPAMARALAQYTMPVADAETGGGITLDSTSFTGDGKLARDLGRAAVRRDINRVYMSPAQAYEAVKARKGDAVAKSFFKLIKLGQLEQASQAFVKATGRRLDVIPFDGGKLHQQFRNGRGRVSRKSPVVIVSDARPLKVYIREIEKRVGWAKSAWFQAGQSVPGGEGGRVPAWMRQPGAPGSSTIADANGRNSLGWIWANGRFEITLHNQTSYIDKILDEHYYLRALQVFYGKIEKEAQAVMEYVLKKLAKNS